MAVTGRTIAAVGTTAELLAEGYGNAVETIDCSGMVVMPGLIVRLKPAQTLACLPNVVPDRQRQRQCGWLAVVIRPRVWLLPTQDAHMHTDYASVRGVAQDVANWMQKGLALYSKHRKAPETHAAVSRAGTRLAILEALKAGTTTFGDYLEAYDGWAESFVEAGVRARLTPNINALPATGEMRFR